MPDTKLSTSRHEHIFLSDHHNIHERRTWFVIGLTLVTMIIEIISGLVFGSMALLADGWHMASHASAMGITALAYYLSKRHLHNRKFVFGTGKIGDLGGFSSALILAFIALLMGYESIKRLFDPVHIAFNEAIIVAFVGLAVNLASALLLKEDHSHSPGQNNAEVSHHHHQDHNLRAAYLHVLADALTSILAIVALVIGRFLGLVFLDPLMGIAGAFVISFWAYGLIKQTASVLLDMNHNDRLNERVRSALKQQDNNAEINDLHIWRVGPGHYGAVISLTTKNGSSLQDFKARLGDIRELSHVTIEIQQNES